jgi:DNA-binding transcriptional regulator YhcF (GntR family)
MDAILESNKSYIEPKPPSLLLAYDVSRGYSKTPRAHTRDMVADGITGNGLAVYHAIADRQVGTRGNSGEYFRSNESLAEETGVGVSTVRRWLAILKKSGYISIWRVNGGRRMRVCTKVSSPASTQPLTSEHKNAHERAPYKENNIKKTTQQQKVCVSSFSDESKSLFGEFRLGKLVASFDLERVERGIQAYEAQDKSSIRNPIAWLTRAIGESWEPKQVLAKGGKFTESAIDHLNIIESYQSASFENAEQVKHYRAQGIDDMRLAFKIYKGKI